MSPLSDWRLPFSGFSSLSLQNKEMPFQKSALHWQGGTLLLAWEWESEGPMGGRVRMIPAPHTPELPHTGFCHDSNKLIGKWSLSIPIYLGFFPFLPWADRMDRKGEGRKKECWKGLEGSVPATRADVKSLDFSFYKTLDNIQGLFISFSFWGGWMKWYHFSGSHLTALGAFLWVCMTNKSAFPLFFCCYFILPE